MIYLVSNQEELYKEEHIYTKVKLEEVIKYLGSVTMTGFDSETTGFDCWTETLYCIQVGDRYNQYLIDNTIDIKVLKPYLEKIVLIMQNAKFDLKFLYRKGVYPRKIYDTYLAERVLYCGIPDHKSGLGFLVEQYMGIKLDKSSQKVIAKEGLNTKNIIYAITDVIYLEQIREKQLVEADKKDLLGTINLENRFVCCLAYIEYCGFRLDPDKWRAKMVKDRKRLIAAEEALNTWIMSRNLKKYIEVQGDLFRPAKCSINWSSPKQVVPLFEELGINCTIVEKGKEKKSVEAGVVRKYEKTHSLIPIYLEMKGAEKVCSTYGQNFIDQINPVTKRLHSKYTQIVDTGRMASGGKDGNRDTLNMQNIPSDTETRYCFVPDKGNDMIVADYNSQESVVLANNSLDEALLEFYDNGYTDMHSYNASKIFKELSGISFDVIKSDYKDKRQIAKVLGFICSYGGSAQAIVDQLNIPMEEAEEFIKLYFETFVGLVAYYKKIEKETLANGYILLDNIIRRKSYIRGFDNFKQIESEIGEDFWDNWRNIKKDKNHYLYKEYKDKISTYFQTKGEIYRRGSNYPIQSQSANCTKIAGIHLYDWIIDNNYFSIVRICNVVHDEFILESPPEISETTRLKLEQCMFKGGEPFCKRVPLKATGIISDKWVH